MAIYCFPIDGDTPLGSFRWDETCDGSSLILRLLRSNFDDFCNFTWDKLINLFGLIYATRLSHIIDRSDVCD